MGRGNQLLNHHEHHGAGREPEKPGHVGLDEGCRENHEDAEDRFHDPGERPADKSFDARLTGVFQRERNGGAFRNILNSDAKRESACGGKRARFAVIAAIAKASPTDIPSGML